jgi:hypothetical protein
MIKTILEGLVFVAMIIATYYFLLLICLIMDRCYGTLIGV